MQQKQLLATLLLAASPLAHAASSAEATGDEIVVTATRIEQPLKQTLASTTVINEQEIRQSQAADVPALLSRIAGVEVARSGGYGKTTSVFLRGSDSTHVLILLDGVRINSATAGDSPIEQIMLDQIERIEVVRGNVSSLYGSEAIGGVVQIFTRQGRNAPRANASVGLGSQGTQKLAAGFGGVIDDNDFHLQVSSFKTDGVSAMNPALMPRANPDRDGYRNNSLSAKLGHAFNADHRVTATLFASDGSNQYDSGFGRPTDINVNRSKVQKFALTADNQLTEHWHSQLQLGQGVDEYRDFLNGAPTAFGSVYKTSHTQLSWQNQLQLRERDQLVLGAESLRQQISTDLNPGYVPGSRQINSLFAGYTAHLGDHQLQANLRQDRNSQYGNVNTGLLGYGYALNDVWRASLSTSTAFRAPTFNELYYPGFGSATLKPVRSRNNELGLHYAADGQQFDAVYFDNRIRDLIVYAPLPVNLNQARSDGMEFSYGGQFGDTRIKAALTAQNPRDLTTGQTLIRRAKLHSNLALSQQMNDWLIGGEWQYSGTRSDANFNVFPSATVSLASYHLFNLTASYALSRELRLNLRADNLTNQNDSSVYGYNPLGRRLMMGVNYQP